MPRLSCWFPLVALLAALTACGEIVAINDAGPNDGDARDGSTIDALDDLCTGDVKLEDFNHCVELTFCNVLERCFNGDRGDTVCEGLDTEIVDDIHSGAFKLILESLIAKNTVTYNGSEVAGCLATIDDIACKYLFGAGGDPFEACGIFVGSVPAGQPCTYDVECREEGSRCEANPPAADPPGPAIACTGNICVTPVPIGQPCPTGSGNFCQPGAYCVNEVCAPGDANAACMFDSDCDADLWCDTFTHKCAAAFGNDGLCTDDRQCMGALRCVGDRRTPPAGKCQSVEVEDAACDSQAGCGAGLYCAIPPAPATEGVCKPVPKEDEPCGVNSYCGLLGFGFMLCDTKGTPATDDDTCRTPGDENDPCVPQATLTGGLNNGVCNTGLICSTDVTGASSGMCQKKQANSQICRNDDNCASTYCSCSNRDANGNCTNNGVCTDYPVCN